MKTEADLPTTSVHGEEIAAGERFEFGANWASFLKELDDDRIRQAEVSLQKMLGMKTLTGKAFIDIGCGSGLFSLAAKRLGARVFPSITIPSLWLAPGNCRSVILQATRTGR